MSTAWVPPRRSYHLRIFAISLFLVVLALAGVLFGVRMEAIAPGSGIIAAKDQQEIRTQVAGLVDLTWKEAPSDDKGGSSQLETGKELSPGQVFAHIRTEAWPDQLERWLGELLSKGRKDAWKERLKKSELRAPNDGQSWRVVKVFVSHLEAVKAGDPIALLVPLEEESRQPRDLVALLEVAEKHAGEIEIQQPVRLYSAMYSQRLYGHAKAEIDKVEPLAEIGQAGDRKIRARAVIRQPAPFPLQLGSSVRAEIVVGIRQVYRIILEQ